MDMVLEALKVLVFGMLGIFFVMGMILLAVKILSFFGKYAKDDDGGDGDDGGEQE